MWINCEFSKIWLLMYPKSTLDSTVQSLYTVWKNIDKMILVTSSTLNVLTLLQTQYNQTM